MRSKRVTTHYALSAMSTFCGAGIGPPSENPLSTTKDWGVVTCKRCIAGGLRVGKGLST